MTNTMNTHDSSRLNATFLEEYNSQESIRKYTRNTAGDGIGYLLDHEYGKIYLDCIEKYVSKSTLKKGIRLWEFGCGGGINLLHLVATLERRGIPVEFACGTDFSETLIAAAEREASSYLKSVSNVQFAVARNESLIEEGAKELGLGKGELIGSFDLVFGVNTIRYGHRLENVDQCVGGISGLLRDSGVCIVIDMNRKFPAFRSRLRGWGKKILRVRFCRRSRNMLARFLQQDSRFSRKRIFVGYRIPPAVD